MGLHIRWIWFLYFLLLGILEASSKELRVVCYYTNWSVYRPGSAKFSPQNINPYLCTHLVYAFGGFTKENTLKPFDKYQDIEKGGYAKFTGLKTYNKNLKTMLAIGGWNEGSSRFSPMVASPERRKELVKNVVKFLRQNHFDGLDLDWEYPSFRDGGKTRDRDNYAQLVQELREEFERESEKTGRTRLLLTMAVPAGVEYINKGYDVPKLMKYLDWMNILSYDYHSAFEPSVNHHAPLYPLEEDSEYNYDVDLNIDHTIEHYLKMGAISDKLVLGIPTYGRSYTLFNPEANEIGAPADGPGEMGDATRENGYLAYYEICDNIKNEGWNVVQPNDDAMGPYAYKDDQWVGYDDESIARKKAKYVVEKNLGGIMFWAIDNDDFRGTCHNKPYPIIEAAKESLIDAMGLGEENVISKPIKPTKRGRTRPKTTRKESESSYTEKTQNSGGRQSIGSPSSRRRNNSRGRTTERPEPVASSRATHRRRPSPKNKSPPAEPIGRETGTSLVVTTPSYKTPEPPTTPDPGGDFKCEDEGFYPHPRDCKKYFWCLSGPSELGIIAHQFTCPAGLYFNKAASSCDYTQNVLCNKKKSTTPKTITISKSSEAGPTTKTTTEAPKKAESVFSFSTRRPPPKITAATSRTTFVASTSTTESPEYEDYEYEDEEEEDNSDSEDPRVIKELLELIKKAGGIDELEKQLNLKGDQNTFTKSDGTTTQSTIAKKLYERVLAKTKLGDINTKQKYSYINRNSRGPQNEGIHAEEKENSRGRSSRPQYSTISRPKSSKSSEVDTDKENEDEEQEDSPGKFKQYTTLNRNRPSSSRNKDEEDDENVGNTERYRSTTISTRSPYVTLRRLRPTTTATEAEEDEEDNSYNRKVLGETSDVTKKDENESQTPNYINIQRGRSTTTESSTSKYKQIYRSTTAADSNDGITSVTEEISPQYETPTANTNSVTASDTNPNITNHYEETTLNGLKKDIVTSTTKLDIIEPQLLEPRPFSFNNNIRSTTLKPTTTEKATHTPKVSYKPLFRSRPVEAPNSNQEFNVNNNNNKVDHAYIRGKNRGASKFTVPEVINTSTHKNSNHEEHERQFRPDVYSDISDLSSLTAVDFSLQKDYSGTPRRPRPTRPTTTTLPTTTRSATTTSKTIESLKSGSRTLPLARKYLESTNFGANRRRGFTTTTSAEDLEIEPKVLEDEEDSKLTKLNRKVIRRFRITTPNPYNTISTEQSTLNEQKHLDQADIPNSEENLTRNEGNRTKLTNTLKRLNSYTTPISYKDKVPKDTSGEIENNSTDDDEDIDDVDEGENIKLSESNILENSDLNRVNTNAIKDGDKKGHQKVIKRIKYTTPKTDETTFGTQFESTTGNEYTREQFTSTTPNVLLRTRKIIRKLNVASTIEPTSEKSTDEIPKTRLLPVKQYTKADFKFNRPTENSNVEEHNNNRRKKIIRRLKTGVSTTESQTYEINNENTSDETINNQNRNLSSPEIRNSRLKLYSRKPPTTTVRTEIINLEEEEDNNDDSKLEQNVTRLVLQHVESFNESKSNLDKELINTTETNNTTEESLETQVLITTESILNYTVETLESTTEDSLEYSTDSISTEKIIEESQNDSTDSTEDTISTDEYGETTEYTDTTEITTPKVTPPPYVNRIFKSAENRPKLNLKTRLNSKYVTESSSSSSTTAQTRYELRSRRPGRFRSTTETYKVEKGDDVGHGTVKQFRNSYRTTTSKYQTKKVETEGELNQVSRPVTEDGIATSKYQTKKVETEEDLEQVSRPMTEDGTSDKKEEELEQAVAITEITKNDTEIDMTTEHENVSTTELTTDITTHSGTLNSIVENSTKSKELEDDLTPNYVTDTSETSTTSTTSTTTTTEPDRVSNNILSTTRKSFSPVLSTTTVKDFINSNSFNRGLYTRPTSKSTTVTQQIDDEDEEEYDLEDDEDDVENKEDDVEETDARFENQNKYQPISRRPYTPSTQKPTSNGRLVTPRTRNTFNTNRKANNPYDNTTKTNNRKGYRKFTSTTPETVTSDLADVNIDALNQRNKELFLKARKMNTPYPGVHSSEETKSTTNLIDTTADPNDIDAITTMDLEQTTGTSIKITTEKPTTLHHIFAETESEPTTSGPIENTKQNKLEKIIEVNRILQVNGDDEKKMKVLDPIGVINRVTSIKVVQGNNSENINTTREDRKFEIYGDSKVNYSPYYPDIANAKSIETNPNKITIDSKSIVKTITPKPLFTNDVSTISLEGLFRTESPVKTETPSSLDDELLDAEHSRYVNVKVLHAPDRSGKFIYKSGANSIKEFGDEEVTMKAQVVEITRPTNSGIIRIAPISVSFEKRIPNIK